MSLAFTSIDLSHNQLGDAACGFFVELLDLLPELKHLYLSFNNLGDACIETLLPSLSRHRRLSRLDLAYNKIGFKAAILLLSKTV